MKLFVVFSVFAAISLAEVQEEVNVIYCYDHSLYRAKREVKLTTFPSFEEIIKGEKQISNASKMPKIEVCTSMTRVERFSKTKPWVPSRAQVRMPSKNAAKTTGNL